MERHRLDYRPPLAIDALFDFLAVRAIPGVEVVEDATYRRGLGVDGRTIEVDLAPVSTAAAFELRVEAGEPSIGRELVPVARLALDLDADIGAIDRALGGDPIVGPLVRRTPGMRLPGTFDGWATTCLAVLGQGVAVGTARALAGRIATRHAPAPATPRALRAFPPAERLADADLSGLGLTPRGELTLARLAREVAGGGIVLAPTANVAATVGALEQVPGIGPWTTGYVAMRVLRDPDAFVPGDAAVARAIRALGLPHDPRAVARGAEGWRPWRAYAVAHLWAAS